jgi:hypothetical protein
VCKSTKKIERWKKRNDKSGGNLYGWDGAIMAVTIHKIQGGKFVTQIVSYHEHVGMC